MKKTNLTLIILLLLSSLSLFGQDRQKDKPKVPFILSKDKTVEIATAIPARAYNVAIFYDDKVTPETVAKSDWIYSSLPYALKFSEVGIKKEYSYTVQHFLYNLTSNTWVIFCLETNDNLIHIYRYNPNFVYERTTYKTD